MARTTVLNRLDEDQTEVVVEYNFSPASPDFYDPSIGGPGGWSPGSAPEVDILKCWTAAEPAVEFEPTEAEVNAWSEQIIDMDDGDDGEDPDRAYDEKRDREDYVYTGSEDF